MLLVDRILDACRRVLDSVKKAPNRPWPRDLLSPTTGASSSAGPVYFLGRRGQQVVSIDGGDIPVDPNR